MIHNEPRMESIDESFMTKEWVSIKRTQYIHKYSGNIIRTYKSFVSITMLNKLIDILEH